ncbi:TetR/AcrR family transcriptional regulator [Streptomyces sp. ST2-7A]|uniref:TetR/AcrR family transcriptional regulator n=1 Tax=Streptomyces sp. ST2-7A TaxID=2907214 RepID=UPI001F411360|nr:TetR/AcrR family transcriptional regulator [Streptomyces sp. ST2-7A]MCE7081226.1 TetR/AcrR family transcriptional regulator [Streptomyces sp. ST2-7A]
MTEATSTAASRRRAPRGRIDKRQAILDAAFTVFAREGYANACVKEIAAEARVAKPTVYNHLNDKANLFHHAVKLAAETALTENLRVVERLAAPVDDLRGTLEDVGRLLLRCYCSDESRALRRLLCAEAHRFPELLETLQATGTSRVTEALADRFARLTLGGHLRTPDPVEAAEQFVALLTGPAEARSRFGTRRLPDEELGSLVRSAAGTFYSAFGMPSTVTPAGHPG